MKHIFSIVLFILASSCHEIKQETEKTEKQLSNHGSSLVPQEKCYMIASLDLGSNNSFVVINPIYLNNDSCLCSLLGDSIISGGKVKSIEIFDSLKFANYKDLLFPEENFDSLGYSQWKESHYLASWNLSTNVIEDFPASYFKTKHLKHRINCP